MSRLQNQQPETEDYNITIKLVSLRGPHNDKPLRIVILKGVQTTDQTKKLYKLSKGYVQFDQETLQCSIPRWNSKKPAHPQFTITLYQVPDDDLNNEEEIGCLHVPIPPLINAFTERNEPYKQEKRESVGSYSLGFFLTVDKAKPGALGLRLQQQTTRQTKQVKEVEAPATTEQPKVDESSKIQEGTEPIRTVEVTEEEVKRREEQSSEDKDVSMSLLNVTNENETHPQNNLQPINEEERPDLLNKPTVQLRHATSVQVETINIEGEKEEPSDKPKTKEIPRKVKLIAGAVIILLLLLFLLTRGGSKKEDDEKNISTRKTKKDKAKKDQKDVKETKEKKETKVTKVVKKNKK